MDIIRMASIAVFIVAVGVILVTSAFNLRDVRQGLGPNRQAVRVQAVTLGVAIFLFALLAIVYLVQSNFGPLAIVGLPFAAVGLVMIQKARTFR
jgi:hypothetical protein